MGCSISSPTLEYNGVRATLGAPSDGAWYILGGNSIHFVCNAGSTLLDSDRVVASGSFTYDCPSDMTNDIAVDLNLKCSPPPTPPPTDPPASIRQAPSTTTFVLPEGREPNHVKCPIPQMPGLVGYQTASNPGQNEIVRFPTTTINSDSNGVNGTTTATTVCNLRPQETIAFSCQDSTQKMLYNGQPLQPHGVEFFSFTCNALEDEEESAEFTVPLTCVDGFSSGGRRQLLRGIGEADLN